jgi:hypothetical protein
MSSKDQPVADAEYIGTAQPEGLVEDLTGSTALPPALPPTANRMARLLTGPDSGVAVSVERLKAFADASNRFARASLAMQVMAGIQLSEIRRLSPYTRGGMRSRKSNPHDAGLIENAHDSAVLVKTAGENDPFAGFATWEAFLGGCIGISADTAGRWMAMAEAARPRLKRIDGWGDLIRDLMERPIASLEPSEIDVLAKAVAKITDGRTQLDFLQELGIVKKPSNPSLGGNTGGRPASSGVLEGSVLIKAATEDWAQAHRALIGGQCGFTVLSDAEIEAQLDTLTRAIRVRREWLATPANKRNQSLVDTLAKTLA